MTSEQQQTTSPSMPQNKPVGLFLIFLSVVLEIIVLGAFVINISGALNVSDVEQSSATVVTYISGQAVLMLIFTLAALYILSKGISFLQGKKKSLLDVIPFLK
jgi:membrane protein implicated in regulation of membrane protease activity